MFLASIATRSMSQARLNATSHEGAARVPLLMPGQQHSEAAPSRALMLTASTMVHQLGRTLILILPRSPLGILQSSREVYGTFAVAFPIPSASASRASPIATASARPAIRSTTGSPTSSTTPIAFRAAPPYGAWGVLLGVGLVCLDSHGGAARYVG